MLERLAILILKIVQKKYERRVKREPVFRYRQNHKTLWCKEDGIPLDREEWFYLPALKKYSREFQPPEEQGNKLYEKPLVEIKGKVFLKET